MAADAGGRSTPQRQSPALSNYFKETSSSAFDDLTTFSAPSADQASLAVSFSSSTQNVSSSSATAAVITPVTNSGGSPQFNRPPQSKTDVSLDLPITTQLQQTTITDPLPPQRKHPIASFPAPSPKHTTHSDPPTGDNKLKQYFNPQTSKMTPFDSLMSMPPLASSAASKASSESAMMNPAYMSPTEAYSFSTSIPSPESFLTPATEQDVFTASLLSSDADRRHDAWIPSESTKKALQAMQTNPPGIYFPEKDLLTMPGIAIKEDFGDPIKSLLRTYVGEEAASKRQVLTSALVTQDDRGLRQLIAAGCYHAAVNLTTQLLTVYGQGEGRAGRPSKHTAHSVQLWFTRLALLVKLRRYSLAEVECEQFGQLDAPDLYFEFYPELYGGRKGSMVPFSFRLLIAELPHFLGKHSVSLDRLNTLLHTCSQIVDNLKNGLSENGNSAAELSSTMREDSLKLWRNRSSRVIYSLTAVAASLKDYRLCSSLLSKLLQDDTPSTAGIYSALGRLHLHLGDISAAQACFNKYLEVSPRHNSPIQGLLHSAYLAMASNDFKQATETLRQALEHTPGNPLVVNNLGVCLVYLGRIRDAVALVEGAVYAEPERLIHESLVLNLATMYELESCNATTNKIKLLELVAQHKGDAFAVAALKLH